MKCRTRSGKLNKERRAKEKAIDLIATILNFDKKLIHSVSPGVNGRDISFDSTIITRFPFAIEVKNQEVLEFGSWWNQTLGYVDDRYKYPLLIFTKNRTAVFCAYRYEDLRDWHVICSMIGDKLEMGCRVRKREGLYQPRWQYVKDCEGLVQTFLYGADIIIVQRFDNFLADYKSRC